MIYLCVISRVSRVISRVISITCDLDAATRVSAISTRRLVEKRKYKQCPGGAAARPRVFLRCAPCSMVGRAGRRKFWMSTAFSRKMASSAPYRSSAHSRARSLTCCLPFYTLSEWRQRRAQLCPQTKSICTKVGRQCQNHGIENGA